MARIDFDEDELLEQLGASGEPVPSDPDALLALLEDVGARQQPSLDGAPWVPAGELTGLDAQFAAPPPQPKMAPAPEPTTQLASSPPNEAASQVMGAAPGTRAFGVQDTRFDPMSAVARVREIYAQRQGQPAQEGPGRFEQEFLSSHAAPDQKRMRMAAMFSGIAGGNPADVWKSQQDRQAYFDQGLMQARMMDRRGPNTVDQGTAELLTMMGISPDAAAATTYDSPLLELVRAGAMHLAGRYRGQDTQLTTKDISEVGDTYRQSVGELGKDRRAQLSSATQLEGARVRKRGGGGGAGAGGNPDALSAFLQRNENVGPEVANAFVQGQLDPASVPGDTYQRLESAATLYRSLDGDKRAQLVRGLLAREGGDFDRPDVAAATKRADPKERLRIKQDTAKIGRQLKEAVSGWNSLSPRAREVIAKIGLQGNVSQIRQAALSPEEQASAGAVFSQINGYVKALSGAAVSGQEWDRIAAELGITGEGVRAFQSANALGAWLQRATKSYRDQVRAIEEQYPGLITGKGE